MSDDSSALHALVRKDPRYPIDAYWFVQEALEYAADSMELESHQCGESAGQEDNDQVLRERHLTGQQLCEAIRRYALNQYGYMARVVLKNWNIEQTCCFGDIVYNMIEGGVMKKSTRDRRSHFDEVYCFDDVFENDFQICDSMAQRRS